MLRRQVSGGFVCLRCQIQRASSINRPVAPLFHRTASREFPVVATTHTRRLAQDVSRQRYSTSNAPKNQEEGPDSPEDPFHNLLRSALDPYASQDSPEETTIEPEIFEEARSAVEEKLQSETAFDGKDGIVPFRHTRGTSKRFGSGRQSTPGWPEDADKDQHQGPRYKQALVSSLRSGYRSQLDESRTGNEALPTDRQGKSVYRRRGARFQAVDEALPAEMLGKPASAIVMRNRGQWKKKNNDEVVVLSPSELGLDSIPLFQQLEQEASEPGIDDIMRTIDELRPKEKIVVHSEFSSVRDTLERGFTTAQLTTYLLRSREDPSKSQHPKRLVYDPEWILERQPWIAAVDDPEVTLEPLLYAYATNSSSPKQMLATQVMRECWGLSTYEVLDQDGYLSVKFRKEEFSILLLGHKIWLSTIARNSSDPGTQLVVSPSIDTISILGKQKTTEAILSEINKALEQARTASFDAHLLSPDALEPAILEEVGRITNTIVRLDAFGQKVLVTWIHSPPQPAELEKPDNAPPPALARPDTLENLGDIVLRYLLHAADTGPRTTTSLTVVPETDKRRGRYIAEQGYENKMSWMERLHKWARYVKPATEVGPELSPGQVFDIPTSLLPLPIDIENRNEMRFDRDPRPSLLKMPVVPYWPSKVTTDTRAVFGHVLHAARAGSRAPLVSRTTALDTARRQTFIPVHPPLRSLKFQSNLKETGLYHAILVLRFVPASEQTAVAPELATTAPPLELRIEIDHKEIKRIISLRAVTGTHTSDIMLPSYPVDVRLVQTTYAELTGRSLDKYAEPVLEFLDNSDIRPWEGMLENPSKLDGIEIPSYLCLPQKEPSTCPSDQTTEQSEQSDNLLGTGSEENTPEQEKEAHKFNYLFASREIQWVTTAEFDGYKVSYWNIDSGKRGGQTTQLCLDAICPDSRRYPEDDLHRRPESFLKVVSEIASGAKYFKWLGNSPDKYVQHL
ncbi:Mitochondrial inner-membrane-bound regulator domain containing protein [Rhypophila sp. PSN 637]